MKARKLELKSIEIQEEVFDDKTKTFNSVKQGTFSYRETVRNILLTPGPKGHNTSEDVIRSISLYGRVKDELRKGSDSILLDREEYVYLLERTNHFPWAVSHAVVADFIKYVRELPEVEVGEASRPIPAPQPAS